MFTSSVPFLPITTHCFIFTLFGYIRFQGLGCSTQASCSMACRILVPELSSMTRDGTHVSPCTARQILTMKLAPTGPPGKLHFTVLLNTLSLPMRRVPLFWSLISKNLRTAATICQNYSSQCLRTENYSVGPSFSWMQKKSPSL